jgi:hypothetical protein
MNDALSDHPLSLVKGMTKRLSDLSKALVRLAPGWWLHVIKPGGCRRFSRRVARGTLEGNHGGPPPGGPFCSCQALPEIVARGLISATPDEKGRGAGIVGSSPHSDASSSAACDPCEVGLRRAGVAQIGGRLDGKSRK